MIICNSKRFIFIHIPKCGGTTISHNLDKKLLPQDVSLAVNPNAGWGEFVQTYRKRFKLYKHSTAIQIANAMGRENFKDYYAFTFCRNPFARAYSAYTFTKRADAKHRPDSERYQEIKDMDFDAFLGSKYMQEKMILQARSQIDWVTGAPKEVHAYKLEETEQNLKSLIARFYGKNAAVADPKRRNFSSSEGEWKNMSPNAASLIRKLYREDFDYFEYPDTLV